MIEIGFISLVGRLVSLSHTSLDIAHTPLDIAFYISMDSQFMHSPRQDHTNVVYRILGYFKGTRIKGLLFEDRDHLKLEVYTDVDWAGSVTNKRSTSRYCTFMEEILLNYKVKDRNMIAGAVLKWSLEEFLMVYMRSIESKKLLKELKITSYPPMKVLSDNKRTMVIASNPVPHDRTKHVEVIRILLRTNSRKVLFLCSTFLHKKKLLILSIKGYQRNNLIT